MPFRLYFRRKPSNWHYVPLAVFALALVYLGCSGSQSQPVVTITDPTMLCANALAISSQVQQQATKLGVEPVELAKQVCAAALLGIRLAEANLPTQSAAGAPSVPTGGAGVAGSGG